MIRIIDGRRYNTETARELTTMSCSANRGDFDWHCTKLYRTDKGNFFLAGKGGARSMWAYPLPNGSGPGDGLLPIGEGRAKDILEAENEIALLEELFAVEDA